MQFLHDMAARFALLMDGDWRSAAGHVRHVHWRFSPWGEGLLLCGVFVALILAMLCYYRTKEGLTIKARVSLASARFGGMLALLLMAAGTICVVNVSTVRLPSLLVILDDSPSMALPITPNETRFFRSKNALWSRGLLNKLKKDFDIEVVCTSGQHAGIDSETSVTPQDLAQLLVRQSTRHRPQPLAHILLVSDGAELGYKRLADAAPELPAPVSTLCIGAESEIKDVILQDVSVPPYVYLHDRALITAQVKSLGIEHDATIKLMHITDTGEKEVGSTTVSVKPGDDAAIARVEFETLAAGLQHFSIRVLPVDGELTSGNNRVDFNLDVRGDKIRVLFVEGEPSWEYRFAKQALESDPVIEFNGLMRLPGDEWFYQGKSTRPDGKAIVQKPKDGFPASSEELDLFNVIILGDLERKIFEQSNRFDLLESYVKRHGGGLVTIGGYKVYTAGNYEDTALGRMVPFNLVREKKLQLVNRFNVQTTTQGIMHPAMQLELDPVKNEEAWSKLPWVEGGNALKAVKPGATVMLYHPLLKTNLGPRPITAAWQYGQGRVFSTALDGTWHWRIARKTDGDYHQRYWGQVARWAAGDPRANKRMSALIFDDPVLEVSKSATCSLTLNDKDGNPDVSATTMFTIEAPDGTMTYGQSSTDPALPGRYTFTFVPAKAGNYKIKAVVSIQGGHAGQLETAVYVAPSRAELLLVTPDPDALDKLAHATGGISAPLAQAQTDAYQLPLSPSRTAVDQSTINLWQSPGLLIFLVACFGFEWLMRKSRGLA